MNYHFFLKVFRWKKSSQSEHLSFHHAISSTLFVAQIFGMMPVCGIFGSLYHLRFTVRSFRLWYAIFLLTTYVLYTFLSIYWIMKKKIELGKIVSVSFIIGNVFISWWMIKIAIHWPRLMKRWLDVQRLVMVQITGTTVLSMNGRMGRKVKLTTFIVLVNSLLEHLLFTMKAVQSTHDCETISDPVKAFFMSTMQPIFFVIKFNIPIAIAAKWSNIAGTFAWNFNDLFIMLVSIGLSHLIQQFNATLMMLRRQRKQQVIPEHFWVHRRNLYKQIGGLVRDIDTLFGPVIVLSFASNCFFICVQMLNSLDERKLKLESIYFWFSLIFLICRTMLVAISAAKVNEESKRAIHLLRYVSRASFNDEVKRFMEHVVRDNIALTGMRFFNVSRRLILSIAGTIITYELVLIQFHQSDQVSDSNPCNATIANISSKEFE